MKKKLAVVWTLPIFFIVGSSLFSSLGMADERNLSVLSTTFPIYQIVRNVTEGRDRMKVDIMLPSQLGCPHDYTLTPQDMKKLAKADILVINGLGMEEFIGAPVKKANPNIEVVDSSVGIRDTLESFGACEHDHGHAKTADHEKVHGDRHHEHGHHHHHHDVNPHLFVSPRMTAKLAMNIAAELSKLDPDGAATYFKNARVYAEAMNKLAEEMAALGNRLKNNRIAQPHGVFDYLARDMGLEIVAVMLPHGQAPSAAGMRHLAKTMKEKGAGAIFTEPQYPEKIGKTLSKETGIPTAMLDPVASGPEDAPLTYYETVMRQNMKTLESTLGVR